MRNPEIEVVYDDLQLDDYTLKQTYIMLSEIISSKEENLKRSIKCADQNNYLHQAIARLAYGFAKEQYESVSLEMQKRGLITSA